MTTFWVLFPWAWYFCPPWHDSRLIFCLWKGCTLSLCWFFSSRSNHWDDSLLSCLPSWGLLICRIVFNLHRLRNQFFYASKQVVEHLLHCLHTYLVDWCRRKGSQALAVVWTRANEEYAPVLLVDFVWPELEIYERKAYLGLNIVNPRWNYSRELISRKSRSHDPWVHGLSCWVR